MSTEQTEEKAKESGELLELVLKQIAIAAEVDLSRRIYLKENIETIIKQYGDRRIDEYRSGFQGNPLPDLSILEVAAHACTGRIKKIDLKKIEENPQKTLTSEIENITTQTDALVIKTEISRSMLEEITQALWNENLDLIQFEIPFSMKNEQWNPKAWRISNINHEYIYYLAPRGGDETPEIAFKPIRKMMLENELKSKQFQLTHILQEIDKFRSEMAKLVVVPEI